MNVLSLIDGISCGQVALLACCVPDWADFNARVFGEHWRVGYTGNASICDKSPATAALKLWLRMKGIEYEKE